MAVMKASRFDQVIDDEMQVSVYLHGEKYPETGKMLMHCPTGVQLLAERGCADPCEIFIPWSAILRIEIRK